jgi:hypothetical protein
MFGNYQTPLELSGDRYAISMKEEGEAVLYRRTCRGDGIEKRILAGHCDVLLSPVEPVNTPSELTPTLLVELATPVVVAPRESPVLYLTFPVEVGVFLSPRGAALENIDIFTLARQKFILYGEIHHGMLCRYWPSPVSSVRPHVDPLREGILELTVSNRTARLTEVSRVVFSAYHMKIYYAGGLAAMRARMALTGDQTAETGFTDEPLEAGMTRAQECYAARRLPGISADFVMEWGY